MYIHLSTFTFFMGGEIKNKKEFPHLAFTFACGDAKQKINLFWPYLFFGPQPWRTIPSKGALLKTNVQEKKKKRTQTLQETA
jgi:hypothetical protein